MASKLIEAIDEEIGEPFNVMWMIFPPMIFFAPFFLLISTVERMARISPMTSERLIALASEDELPFLRNVICKAQGSPTGHALRRLRSVLERRTLERDEAAAIERIKEQCHS